MQTLTLLSMGAEWWTAVLMFAVFIFVLDRLDVALPRGDSIGVSGALCAAAVVEIHPPVLAGAICIGSVMLAQVGRLRSGESRRAFTAIAGRLAGLFAAYAVAWHVPVPTVYSSGLKELAGAASVAASFLLGDFFVSQLAMSIETHRPFVRMLRGSIRMQAPVLAAQFSASVLAMLTFVQMRAYSLVPVVALLLLMRQSYAMLLEIREAYRTTSEVLVEAAEAQDKRRIGHSERTAAIARNVAMKVGLPASDVERISYAALLHDVDAIGDEWADDSSLSPLTTGQSGRSSVVLEEASFFADILEVVRVCDGDLAEIGTASQSDLQAAFIVALASDIDATERPQVAEAHKAGAVGRIADAIPSPIKAAAAGAALALGYKIPSVH